MESVNWSWLNGTDIHSEFEVALRMESVNWSHLIFGWQNHAKQSLSAWRAWIEAKQSQTSLAINQSRSPHGERELKRIRHLFLHRAAEVALRMESVNWSKFRFCRSIKKFLSLSAWRAWIEATDATFLLPPYACRSPHGERELKPNENTFNTPTVLSRSPHGERELKL